MSDLLLVVLGAVLLLTNGYWWRRTRTTRAALRRSEARDERVADRVETDPEEAATLREAAAQADCQPEQVPERIATLGERIREYEHDIERIQKAWASSWWEALTRPAVNLNEPHVLSMSLPSATTDDVQQFAAHAQHYEEEVAIIVAPEEGTVAVSVGTALTDRLSATEVLEEITEAAGGDGGGSATFAIGGGSDPERLPEVAVEVRDTLAARLAEDG
jgi:alanyl-tRNA synthetase